MVVSAAVADAGLLVAVPALFVGLLVAEPVLFAGLLAVAAEELLSCLFVEGFDVSEEDAAEAADDELPADKVPLSALQPQADIITAAHKIREMMRFFIFLFHFHFRLPAVNVIRQGLYSIAI